MERATFYTPSSLSVLICTDLQSTCFFIIEKSEWPPPPKDWRPTNDFWQVPYFTLLYCCYIYGLVSETTIWLFIIFITSVSLSCIKMYHTCLYRSMSNCVLPVIYLLWYLIYIPYLSTLIKLNTIYLHY